MVKLKVSDFIPKLPSWPGEINVGQRRGESHFKFNQSINPIIDVS
jgi:hypothetical protein